MYDLVARAVSFIVVLCWLYRLCVYSFFHYVFFFLLSFFLLARSLTLFFSFASAVFVRSTAIAMLVFNWGAKVVVAIRRMPFIYILKKIKKRDFSCLLLFLWQTNLTRVPPCAYASIYFQDSFFLSKSSIAKSYLSYSMTIQFVFQINHIQTAQISINNNSILIPSVSPNFMIIHCVPRKSTHVFANWHYIFYLTIA